MTAIQDICARIALQTGGGLADAIRKHYPKPVLYFCVTLLFIANTIRAAASSGLSWSGLFLAVAFLSRSPLKDRAEHC